MAADIDLASKVAALSRPETYPDAPPRVEVIETHMSFVFLTPQHAYKLKKPARYPFLDFSTLELRRRYCDEELRLNQRLAAGVYLDVVALRRGPEGRLHIAAEGVAIEWLVKMARLPREHRLDERIRLGALPDHELIALAARLAGFYRSCGPEPIAAELYRSRLRAEIETDRTVLDAHAALLEPRVIETALAALADFVERRHALLDRRIDERRIVEGHGDLRPEHVYLLAEPVVLDALEFNRALRIVDPADELAFLALECERLGAARVGPILFREYADRTGDAPPAPLIDFYKARRASLRARLCILHLPEIDGQRGARWVEAARRYLAMAAAYARCFRSAADV